MILFVSTCRRISGKTCSGKTCLFWHCMNKLVGKILFLFLPSNCLRTVKYFVGKSDCVSATNFWKLFALVCNVHHKNTNHRCWYVSLLLIPLLRFPLRTGTTKHILPQFICDFWLKEWPEPSPLYMTFVIWWANARARWWPLRITHKIKLAFLRSISVVKFYCFRYSFELFDVTSTART